MAINIGVDLDFNSDPEGDPGHDIETILDIVFDAYIEIRFWY